MEIKAFDPDETVVEIKTGENGKIRSYHLRKLTPEEKLEKKRTKLNKRYQELKAELEGIERELEIISEPHE